MNISIIGGRGSMGRVFEKIFLSKGINVKIYGRQNYSELKNGIGWSDMIIISVPLDKASNIIQDVADIIKSSKSKSMADKIVIDFSSVMECNLFSMKELKCNCAFVHPLFGPDISSLKNLNFAVAKVNGDCNSFIQLLEEEDACIINISPSEHDKTMAVVQGLTHFNNFVFAKTLTDFKPIDKRLYTTLFNLNKNAVDRMFSQLPHVASNIQLLNKHVPDAIDNHIINFQHIHGLMKKKDVKSYESLFMDISSKLAVKASSKDIKIKKRIWDKSAVGVLGPMGSFTDSASKFLGESKKIYLDTIAEIIKAVKEQKIKLGIIPLENSIHGTIVETLDGINYSGLHIIKAIDMPIHHCIASLSNASKIDYIYSHPQALMQCANFISKKYPEAKLVNALSTSEAFQIIKEKQLSNAAAIGPKMSADIYGLSVIKEEIEDEHQNKTRFAVVSSDSLCNEKAKKTSLVILPLHEKQGLLFNLLKFFADEKINLTKIESRPMKDMLGKYIFYIDIDGNIDDNNIQRGMSKIAQNIGSVRVLGCYEVDVV